MDATVVRKNLWRLPSLFSFVSLFYEGSLHLLDSSEINCFHIQYEGFKKNKKQKAQKSDAKSGPLSRAACW